jgi:hypothetical protein
MDTSTYAGRVATAHQLRDALRRAPGDVRPVADTGGPIGDCGRPADQKCGMLDPAECKTHCDVPDGDPETMNYAGTLAQRREQLKAARRQGLRF